MNYYRIQNRTLINYSFCWYKKRLEKSFNYISAYNSNVIYFTFEITAMIYFNKAYA